MHAELAGLASQQPYFAEAAQSGLLILHLHVSKISKSSSWSILGALITREIDILIS